MNQKAVVAIWMSILAVMVLGAGAVGYKVYKRMQAKKMMQWEGKMALNAPEQLTDEQLVEWAAEMDKRMDREGVVKPVIEELNLVATWQVPDEAAAMDRLKSSTKIVVEDGKLIFSVRDRDKDLIPQLQKSLGQSYDRALKAEREASLTPTGAP
ncbi:hypothetical protein [Haloferula sargassicola]|uniref:Uncharacterized protein n=1 Tax=Haloferula sargassicola TaxID=490096 RepID=A0ABP9UJE1_9BACT